LGHAHVELDVDGLARSVYLKEGLANAYWPHLSVALLNMLDADKQPLPGERAPDDGIINSLYYLKRDYHVMTPYAGPPGHFKYISYAKVLRDPDVRASLRDKIIFVGATATGLGDLLPTPVSAFSQPMPGVEVNANIFDALRQGLIIEALEPTTRYILSALIVLLPVFLFPRLSPRSALFMSVALILGTLAFSLIALISLQRWFPPAAPLLALTLAYPLWSWRRLEQASRFLNQELTRLHQEPALLSPRSEDLAPGMQFISTLIPVLAWRLYQNSKTTVAEWQQSPQPTSTFTQQTIIDLTPYQRPGWLLAITLAEPRAPSKQETSLLLELVNTYLPQESVTPDSSLEIFETRILQVQETSKRIRAMRRFMDDSLNQMADGVIVINNLGQINFINAKAISHLGLDNTTDQLRHQYISALLNNIELEGPQAWPQVLQQTLLEATSQQLNSRSSTGHDLLIQLSPLALERHQISGLIINLSDISYLRNAERQRAETFSFLSHDLRSPLASLLALVQITKLDDEAMDKAEIIDWVEVYSNRTLNLANDFLDLSQVEHSVDLNFEPLDLCIIAANAVDSVWHQSSIKHIQVNDLSPDSPVYINGSAKFMERALINLLSNAIKYSPENASVEVTIQQQGGRLRCCINDTGLGIPEQDLAKIFDRYFRVNTADRANIQGSGLGLAFVKTVIEKHGGEMHVESEVGKGSRFCFELASYENRNMTAD
ncbi:MAG TPA: CHASE2 domain-containing protein, partial [Candidatus Tenderia electrophaga]|nr:CHASE2 domain-containing protein [Candidatus Tenderia electrophaga]